jgi:HPt (histidine-containing phosphotransfer) domain-containing protein
MEIDTSYLKEKLKDDFINLGFDEDSLDIGLDTFIESFYDSYPNLVSSIEQEDYENIRFHAHTLKGTFANFENNEFKNLSELFKKIEFMAKDKKDLEQIKILLEQVKKLSKNWLLNNEK